MNLKLARAIISLAVDKASALGIRVVVVVLDASGHLVSLDRMDGTRLLRDEFARAKAFTAVFFGRPSRDQGATRESNPGLYHGSMAVLGSRAMFVGGGVPVLVGGQVVGAVGVSGGNEAQDHQVASESAAEAVAALG
jgi:uncharacterized protein GlcG (DUF336 family)